MLFLSQMCSARNPHPNTVFSNGEDGAKKSLNAALCLQISCLILLGCTPVRILIKTIDNSESQTHAPQHVRVGVNANTHTQSHKPWVGYSSKSLRKQLGKL